jgi:phosphoserine phosphatase
MMHKASIYDVDGTLFQGSCIPVFNRHLFEKGLFEKKDLLVFDSKYGHDIFIESYKEEILAVYLDLIFSIPVKRIQQEWDECIKEKIVPIINHRVASDLHRDLDSGKIVMLASGSPKFFIDGIARYFGVDDKYVVATELKLNHGNKPVLAGELCSGQHKYKSVISVLKTNNISLHHCIVYSNNQSDRYLMENAGKSVFIGREHLSDIKYPFKAIEKKHKVITPLINNLDTMEDNLSTYYLDKLELINKSMEFIIPRICTRQTMNDWVGKNNYHWDIDSMQTAFFEIINKHLDHSPVLYSALATCLFIELAGKDPKDFLSIIAMGEFIKISYDMFKFIDKATSQEHLESVQAGFSDLAILGNTSIALMSLSCNRLLFDNSNIPDSTRLSLVEMYISFGLKYLIGNGMHIFRQENAKEISLQQYNESALLIRNLHFCIPTLFYASIHPECMENISSYTDNLAISYQLQYDKENLINRKFNRENHQNKYPFRAPVIEKIFNGKIGGTKIQKGENRFNAGPDTDEKIVIKINQMIQEKLDTAFNVLSDVKGPEKQKLLLASLSKWIVRNAYKIENPND